MTPRDLSIVVPAQQCARARINLSQETSLSIQWLTSQSTVHFIEYKEMLLMTDRCFIVHKRKGEKKTEQPLHSSASDASIHANGTS